MNIEQVRQVLEAFEREQVAYVICGGVALNLLGLARATADLDVFIEPRADNIARLRRALHSVFDDPSIDEISAEDLLGDYPAVQYVPPEGEFFIDILTRLGDAFSYADLAAQRLPFENLTVNVVTPRTLYAMKKDTARHRDRADALALRRLFHLEDD